MSELRGYQKAAVLLITLGVDLSAQVLRNLSDEAVERITAEISRVHTVPIQLKDQVLEEASSLAVALQSLDQGGLPYARQVLEQTFSPAVAEEILARLARRSKPGPFDSLSTSDPYLVASFLQHERPQTIAAVLAHLSPNETAVILGRLPRVIVGQVAMCVAAIDRLAPEVVKTLSRAIAEKRMLALDHAMTAVGGPEFLAKVLNRTDRGTEKRVLEWLDSHDGELAERIRQQILVFENLAQLDDRSMQRVLRELDLRDLALVLKLATEQLRELVLRNLSSRMVKALRDEMADLGPVPLALVEKAQSRVMEVVRRLEEAEEIIVGHRDEVLQ